MAILTTSWLDIYFRMILLIMEIIRFRMQENKNDREKAKSIKMKNPNAFYDTIN